MSMRKHFFLYPLIVFIAFLFFSITTNEASPNLELRQPQTIEEIKALIQVGPGVDDPCVKKQRLAEKIFADYKKLKELFDSNDPNERKKMAKILGKKATIVKPDKEKIRKEKIKKYWKDEVPQSHSVQFILNWAHIVFEEKETEEMDDYDHIAYESFKFHLYPPPEPDGKILKNQTGGRERSCRHTRICNCITR